MEALSAIMLTFVAALLCLSVPRIYGDWLFFKSELREGRMERLPRLLAAENRWVQRHFWYAVLAVGMVLVIEASTLSERAPYLSQVTSVYAALSLAVSFVESLFAQKIATVLVLVRGRREDEPSES